MNLVFKPMDVWYDSLGKELQEEFDKNLKYLVRVAKSWEREINRYCKENMVEEVKVNLNLQVMRQALIDAFDDLNRLKEYHDTKYPNPIKIMAYYVYWIVKRKPITIINEDILLDARLSGTKKSKLLFCNEHYCIQLILDAIFPRLSKNCANKKIHTYAEAQLIKFKRYMLYYLTYRLESPKSLEAIMLSATMHPIWQVEKIIWEKLGDIFEEDL